MSEEMFYNRVRESLSGYSPEVPQSVYAGMRRKLWLSRFIRFNSGRMNIWYLLLLLGIGGGALAYTTSSISEVSATKAPQFEVDLIPVKAITTCSSSSQESDQSSVAAPVSSTCSSSVKKSTNGQKTAVSLNENPGKETVPSSVTAAAETFSQSNSDTPSTDTPIEESVKENTKESKKEPVKKGKELVVKVYKDK